MFKRVAFTTLLAAGLFAIPAVTRTDDPLPCPDGCGPDLSAQLAAVSAPDMRTDDPLPCPDGCGPDLSAQPSTLRMADKRTDDPLPCPDGCGPDLSAAAKVA